MAEASAACPHAGSCEQRLRRGTWAPAAVDHWSTPTGSASLSSPSSIEQYPL